MKQNAGPVAIVIGAVIAIGIVVLMFVRAGQSDSVNNAGPIGQRPGYAGGNGGGPAGQPPANINSGPANAGGAPQGPPGGYRPGMAGQGR